MAGTAGFANSDLGELLRTDVTGSLHSAAVARPQDSWWSAWGQLPAALADGRVPYELARGQSFWDDLDADAEAESRFNTFMAQKTTAFLSGLLRHYDFSPARRVIDVGGGTRPSWSPSVPHPLTVPTCCWSKSAMTGAVARPPSAPACSASRTG